MPFNRLRSKITSLPYWQVYVGGTLLVLVTAIAWYFMAYLGPKHVFWGMIDNSLATNSVVVKTSQGNQSERLEQTVHVDTGTTHRARSLTTLKQGGGEVKTEIIGTPDADYTRYLHITSKKRIDTSKVVGVWSKSSDDRQSGTQASGHQLYAQSVLGIGLPLGTVPVPLGKLKPEQRQDLVSFARDEGVYQPAFKKAKKEYKNGRLEYTYDVKVQAILYVRMMQQFARNLGFDELQAVDPNTYRNAPLLPVKLTVDAQSRQLRSVDLGGKGYSQRYESYGSPLKVEVPKKTISAESMQQRLDEVRKQMQ